jgi:hypothetical protein
VPIVDDMERAMAATTLPALILGGEVAEDQQAAFATCRRRSRLPTVKGLVIGRSLPNRPATTSPRRRRGGGVAVSERRCEHRQGAAPKAPAV